MRISVAATAPFGADVLERLAARHEVAALLTRPDSPAGRGRKLAAPPAKVVAERLGITVLQPERPTADRELDLSRPEESLNRIRALSPHIGARGELDGRRVTIWKARLEGGQLVPVEVQPEGGTRMGYDDWLRGLL